MNGLDKLSDLRIYASDLGDTGKVIYFPELMSLTISNCNLEKFDFVKGRVLKDLDLTGNKTKNINEIQNLETVINLNLSYNEISDLDGLERAPNFVTLNLAGNQISNVDILRELKSLINVNLTGNPITDFEAAPGNPYFNIVFNGNTFNTGIFKNKKEEG